MALGWFITVSVPGQESQVFGPYPSQRAAINASTEIEILVVDEEETYK